MSAPNTRESRTPNVKSSDGMRNAWSPRITPCERPTFEGRNSRKEPKERTEGKKMKRAPTTENERPPENEKPAFA